MTSTALQPSIPAKRQLSFSGLILVALGGLLLLAYALLPFINQPELGPTTVNVLTASRSNNELGVTLNGIVLPAFAGLGVLILGIWTLFTPQIERMTSLLAAMMGVLGLSYYVIFFMASAETSNDLLVNLGLGFWIMLILGLLSLAQIFFPRPPVEEGYEARRILGNQESVIFFGLIGLVVLVGIASPRFVAERNLSDLLQGHAYIAVAAIGMSMVIITGNIDISVGSLVGLLAVISGRLSLGGAPDIVAWVIPVILGGGVGALIGFMVAYLRIPSIVVTLGMLSILKGGLIIWTSGQRVVGLQESYFLAQMRPLGIPMPIYFMVILTILAALFMRYTDFGRYLYAVGGNKEAARLSGISEQRIVLQVFIINGLFAGVASILYATQLSTIQATPPPALELLIITSSVVGGVSILGGTGTVLGSTLAAILLNAIRSAMVFINVSPFWLQAVQGILILLTVLVDLLRRRRQSL